MLERGQKRKSLYKNFIYEKIKTSVTRLDDLLDLGKSIKPLETINSPKSPTFLGNFCKGVKIFKFSCEIIFGQIL